MCIKSLFRKCYTDLKFTALEVKKGDAFLLEKGDWKCLFDSGIDNKIVDILYDEQKITELDLAICSHNDIDHAGGFIELLKSQKKIINIKEIWLPSFWASILQFASDKRNYSCGCFDIDKYLNSLNPNDIKYTKDESDLNSLFDDNTITERDLDQQMSEFFRDYDNYKNNHKTKNKSILYKTIKAAYGRIIDIVKLAHTNNCKIRWFQSWGDKCTFYSIDSNVCSNLPSNISFMALNSLPISNIPLLKSVGNVIKAIYLTTVNEFSLAFEFYYNDIPVVRFSADSGCTCQKQPYVNDIIITAPHHGSDDPKNVNVYNSINGNNIIWVRSDFINKKRPGKAFKNLTNKYCLRCNHNSVKESEIIFEYKHNTWNNKKGIKCRTAIC